MPLTGVINYVFAFIFADFSPVSVINRTRLVSKQLWSHSQPEHIAYTTHF